MEYIKSFNTFHRIIIKYDAAKLECSHYKRVNRQLKEMIAIAFHQWYYCRSRGINIQWV